MIGVLTGALGIINSLKMIALGGALVIGGAVYGGFYAKRKYNEFMKDKSYIKTNSEVSKDLKNRPVKDFDYTIQKNRQKIRKKGDN